MKSKDMYFLVKNKKRETHHHGYLSKSNNYAYITEIRLLDEAVVLILDDINQMDDYYEGDL